MTSWGALTATLPAMVVVALIAVDNLVGAVKAADEVIAGTLGAVEGVYACDAPPDLVVGILIPCNVLILSALACCASLHTYQPCCEQAKEAVTHEFNCKADRKPQNELL